MKLMNRRNLIKAMIATGTVGSMTSALSGCSLPVDEDAKPKVIVVGGGFGGATCAKYLKRFDDKLDVTLIEPKESYMTCPGSNWYLAGLVEKEYITHDYRKLQDKHGVAVIHDKVTDINARKQTVTLSDGSELSYDRLVVSPGIDFRFDAIEGYSADVIEQIPHAYQAGPQTDILYRQIREMKQGGTFIMSAPANPFRCPPGPYERVSMIADYFKKHNPTAKIIVLDAKSKFSKQGLFMEGWQELYGSMIEWFGEHDGGAVTKVEADSKTVHCDLDTFTADVLNIIPPQQAGKIAFDAGLVDESGWCPVNQETFESMIHRGIHVIGDAAIAGKMPKSGHSAASQAKMCAAAIVSQMHNWAMPRPKNVNTCYSLVGADYGISVAAVYHMQDGKIVGIEGAGGVSPHGATLQFRKMEATYANGWYKNITADIWDT
ncbi:NAD(P)/FAD-dependent oxidoreductase [Thiomicrorhabdus heinhorstiae]|uniref:FAD-dependent oxidoreductase n=1 Tax=Thiomicrorhabdus heinhorstiae TaxID=2748010 RepID=A0ABS0BWN0_9GAMM|nr:NAD(P)/FAD-dependent oxidoreductase [Thiomicrorhabdus heinhorstiae]MBF6058215.1 FAD-dependent oxidoreductase [Thiomicrorhabdus heinhorstiae]